MHYLNILLAFIANHSTLAYVMIFLVSLTESLALVGLLVPGTLIIFSTGAVVATGSLNLVPVLLMTIIGAVVGDGISYRLGYYYKDRLISIWPFSRHPGMLKKGEAFFYKHGGKSILIGRFVGPIRPIIPLVAGILGMRPIFFSVINILSAIGWAFVCILPGVFFGASLTIVGSVSTRLVVLILVLVIVVWILIWLCRKIMFLFEHVVPKELTALKLWSTSETLHNNSVVRYVKRFLSFLIFSKPGEEVLFTFLALLLFAAVWGFFGILQDVLAKDPLVLLDQAVYHFLQSLRTPWMDNIFVAVTELGDSFVNIILSSTILLVLLVKRCYRAALFWMFVVLGGIFGVHLLKYIIHLPRPTNIYHGVSTYSFPSSHTTMNVVIYGFLSIMMVRQIAAKWRWVMFFAIAFIAFIIGFSRLYLGAHWFSDVLGGYFIGTCWITLLGIAYLKQEVKNIPQHLLIGVVIVIVIVAGGWHVAEKHTKDLLFYAPCYKVQIITRSSWLTNGWRNFPVYRIDMLGEKEQPLTIQLLGSTDELVRFLVHKGWQHPTSLNLKDFLKMLSSDTPIGELPVLPLLHNGWVDSVRLVKPVDDKHQWVFRLWPTYVKTFENNTPIYEGTIEVQKLRHIADMFLIATDSKKYDLPMSRLESLLEEKFPVKMVKRESDEIMLKKEHHKLEWYGDVLLISQDKPPIDVR